MKWFIGALVLLAAAFALQSGLLAYAMYVLLALLVVSRLLTLTWIDDLEVSRHCTADEIEVGESVSVLIVVSNEGGYSVPWALLEDIIPAKSQPSERNRLRVKNKPMMMTRIPAGGYKSLDYQIEFVRRGYYQIGPLLVETGDFFGLHRRYLVGTEPHFVLVYPKVVPLQGYEIASRRPIGEVRMTHRLYEDPSRIAGVREYQSGDSINRIHWRATARMASLHSKVYEPSSISGATIVLDFHRRGYAKSKEPERSELAVTAAASLASALCQMGQQAGLITNAQDSAERIRQEGWEHDFRTRQAALKSIDAEAVADQLRPLIVPTKRGADQFQQIWSTLARIELTEGLDLDQLIAESASELPRDATIIVILPRVPVGSAIALGNLHRRGYLIVAILVAMSEAQQKKAEARLAAEGIEVRTVHDEESLSVVCQRQALKT